MEQLIPLLDIHELHMQAKDIVHKNEVIMSRRPELIQHEIIRRTNDLIISKIFEFDELPELYYQGTVYESGERKEKKTIHQRIIGVKKSSRIFILEGNPFHEKPYLVNILDSFVNSGEIKWLPHIEAIAEKDGAYMVDYLLAGAEYEFPATIGYLMKDVNKSSIGKTVLQRFEE